MMRIGEYNGWENPDKSPQSIDQTGVMSRFWEASNCILCQYGQKASFGAALKPDVCKLLKRSGSKDDLLTREDRGNQINSGRQWTCP